MQARPHIYVIAGEASGDFIGSTLIYALKTHAPDVQVSGIGGSQMQQAGLCSLFDINLLSVMGFVEVLPHIFAVKARIKETVADILTKQPDIVVTIDSPGFSFRVAKALRESAKYHGKLVHYVAPTVWAYKPGRAAKTAKLYDMLLTLLPFEPPYFEAHGLKTIFTGHPIAYTWKNTGDGVAFRRQHAIADDTPLLLVLPGSRINELRRHLPVIGQAIPLIQQHQPNTEIVMPMGEHLLSLAAELTSNWPIKTHLINSYSEKKDAFAACNQAIAKSGTVALEAVLAGLPTVTIFKAHPISVWLAKRLVSIPYAHLANILCYFEDKPAIVPELIQEECTPEAIAAQLNHFQRQQELTGSLPTVASELIEKLGAQDTLSPSDKAASGILSLIADK